MHLNKIQYVSLVLLVWLVTQTIKKIASVLTVLLTNLALLSLFLIAIIANPSTRIFTFLWIVTIIVWFVWNLWFEIQRPNYAATCNSLINAIRGCSQTTFTNFANYWPPTYPCLHWLTFGLPPTYHYTCQRWHHKAGTNCSKGMYYYPKL